MDSDAIDVFFRELNIELNMLSFDHVVTIPRPFSDIASDIIVSDTDFRKWRSLNEGSGNLEMRGILFKELLKPLATDMTDTSKSATAKRKQCSSSYLESSAKRTRADHRDSLVSQTAGTSTTAADDQIELEAQEVNEAIHHLNAFLEKENLEKLKIALKNSKDDVDLEIGLGIHLLSKLAGEAFTSTRKSLRSCPCGCPEKIQAQENMWIGSQDTWYGELDILTGNPAMGSSVSVSFDQETADSDTEVQNKQLTEQSEDIPEETDEQSEIIPKEDESESPEDRTNVEVKYSSTGVGPKLNEMIAQAVVFAFTEYNRHETKGKCIPSILMNKAGFQFVIYNPADDLLLVSNNITFVDEASFDPAFAFPFVLLWIVLNHRIFFSKHPDFKKICVKSGFHEKMTGFEHFQNLTEYSKCIVTKQLGPLSFPDDAPSIVTNEGKHWFLNNRKFND